MIILVLIISCIDYSLALSAQRFSNPFLATILAYGQTGAGKTFTMTGASENYKHRGLIPRAISHIFKEVEERPDLAFNIRISYMEIYNEQMVDLLSTGYETIHENMSIIEEKNGLLLFFKCTNP